MRVIYTWSNAPRGSSSGLAGRIAGLIISVLALAAAAFFGFFIFLFVFGLVVIAGSLLALRLWWFKRRIEKEFTRPPAAKPPPRDYIDVEFTEHKP